MGVCCQNQTVLRDAGCKNNFIRMLETPPLTHKFKSSIDSVILFEKAWKSSVFGGSVLQPVGCFKHDVRNRVNSLREELIDCEVDQMNGGGYYQLEGVVIAKS
jgi:hypothetical protein